MERLSFGVESSFTPRDDRLEGVTVAPLTPPTAVRAAVLEGEGHVSGGDGSFVPIAAGEAVFWSAGEEHETLTDSGLTVLVIEAEGLSPARAS
jgi:hypothetical protein